MYIYLYVIKCVYICVWLRMYDGTHADGVVNGDRWVYNCSLAQERESCIMTYVVLPGCVWLSVCVLLYVFVCKFSGVFLYTHLLESIVYAL